MLAHQAEEVLDFSGDDSLPLAIRQLLHLSVTPELHLGFCELFAISADSRAASVGWRTAWGESTRVLRVHEWWQVVRHAKSRDNWTRKVIALGGPTHPAMSQVSDWPRFLYLLVANLNENWNGIISEAELSEDVRVIVADVGSPLANSRSPFAVST
jgi:hypothetical protein